MNLKGGGCNGVMWDTIWNCGGGANTASKIVPKMEHGPVTNNIRVNIIDDTCCDVCCKMLVKGREKKNSRVVPNQDDTKCSNTKR